jgi:hypothetical protein
MAFPIPLNPRERALLVLGAAAGVAVGHFLSSRWSRASTASAGAQPRVLPGPARVVQIAGEVTVDEHVGRAGNGDRGLSLAVVTVERARAEMVQTPAFDEYILVLKGELRVAVGASPGRAAHELVATAGQTLHLPRGFTYQVSFPGPAEFVPVCLPAFAPELSGRAA